MVRLSLSPPFLEITMERYYGKVALVTGASSGIGAQILKILLQNRMKVVGLARRKSMIESIGEELPKYKQNLIAIETDVTIESQIKEAFAWTSKHVGPVSVVINNAGVLKQGDVIDGDFSNWKTIIDTNLMGVAVTCREAIKIMRDHNITDGYIININSFLGHNIDYAPGINFYSVSKHALTALTKHLKVELIKSGSSIRIASLSPGLVDTDMVKVANIFHESPLLHPNDIAEAVKYILSTRSCVQIEELTIRPVGEIF